MNMIAPRDRERARRLEFKVSRVESGELRARNTLDSTGGGAGACLGFDCVLGGLHNEVKGFSVRCLYTHLWRGINVRVRGFPSLSKGTIRYSLQCNQAVAGRPKNKMRYNFGANHSYYRVYSKSTDMGECRLRKLAPRGQRQPGCGVTQPRIGTFAELCNLYTCRSATEAAWRTGYVG